MPAQMVERNGPHLTKTIAPYNRMKDSAYERKYFFTLWGRTLLGTGVLAVFFAILDWIFPGFKMVAGMFEFFFLVVLAAGLASIVAWTLRLLMRSLWQFLYKAAERTSQK
jgi:hypothetical protein